VALPSARRPQRGRQPFAARGPRGPKQDTGKCAPAVVPEAIAYPYTWLAGHAARLWAGGNAVLLFATLLVERLLVGRVQVGWWYPLAWVLLLAALVGAGMSIFRLTVRADEDRKTFGAQAVQGSPAVAVGSLTLGATLALLTVLARFIG
jgi:hypothetical protein